MTNQQKDNIRLRQLLEIAKEDFSADGFSNELLNETKDLLRKLAGSLINYFTQGLPFGISQPQHIGDDKLKFKVQSNSGMVFITIDKEGNFL
jgi:hypothetical protein